MKLFDKHKFTWNEPSFFLYRIRSTKDWLWMGGPFVAGGILLSLLMMYAGQTIAMSLLLGLGLGLLCWFAIEFGGSQRSAELDDDSIHVSAGGGKIEMHWNYPLREISQVVIRRKGEQDFPHGYLHLFYQGKFAAIGFPDEIRVERLALALHRLGVAVELSGWRPPELTEGFENDLFLAPDCYVPQKTVQVTPVPESDRMENSLGEKIAAITIGVGPFLAFLISMIVLLVWGGMHWRELTSVHWVIAIVYTIGGMWLTGAYVAFVGEFWADSLLMKATLKRWKNRPGLSVDLQHPQTVPVYLYPDDQWDKALPKSLDYGFLFIDEQQKVLRYEGSKERMEIPREAIQSIRVAEVQYGGAGETVTGELRCYVALVVNRPDWSGEIGLKPAMPQAGKNTDARRFSRASDLFDKVVQLFR